MNQIIRGVRVQWIRDKKSKLIIDWVKSYLSDVNDGSHS